MNKSRVLLMVLILAKQAGPHRRRRTAQLMTCHTSGSGLWVFRAEMQMTVKVVWPREPSAAAMTWSRKTGARGQEGSQGREVQTAVKEEKPKGTRNRLQVWLRHQPQEEEEPTASRTQQGEKRGAGLPDAGLQQGTALA